MLLRKYLRKLAEHISYVAGNAILPSISVFSCYSTNAPRPTHISYIQQQRYAFLATDSMFIKTPSLFSSRPSRPALFHPILLDHRYLCLTSRSYIWIHLACEA